MIKDSVKNPVWREATDNNNTATAAQGKFTTKSLLNSIIESKALLENFFRSENYLNKSPEIILGAPTEEDTITEDADEPPETSPFIGVKTIGKRKKSE